MRYDAAFQSSARQPRTRRIGRCARCHAPVLADEEHYGYGAALIHGACGTEPLEPGAGPRPTARTACPAPPPARRLRPATPALWNPTPAARKL